MDFCLYICLLLLISVIYIYSLTRIISFPPERFVFLSIVTFILILFLYDLFSSQSALSLRRSLIAVHSPRFPFQSRYFIFSSPALSLIVLSCSFS